MFPDNLSKRQVLKFSSDLNQIGNEKLEHGDDDSNPDFYTDLLNKFRDLSSDHNDIAEFFLLLEDGDAVMAHFKLLLYLNMEANKAI